MLPSITASSSGHWNHDGSRKWQRAMRPSVPRRSQTKMSPRKPRRSPCLRTLGGARQRHGVSAAGQTFEDLLDQRHALVTSSMRTQTRALTSPSVATWRSRIRARRRAHSAGNATRIEVAPGGTADKTAGAELPRQGGVEHAGRDRAILQRGGAVVELDQRREARADLAISARIASTPAARRSAATPPGTTRSIIRRWPKAASAARSTRSRRMPQWACMMAKDASLQIAPMSPR